MQRRQSKVCVFLVVSDVIGDVKLFHFSLRLKIFVGDS